MESCPLELLQAATSDSCGHHGKPRRQVILAVGHDTGGSSCLSILFRPAFDSNAAMFLLAFAALIPAYCIRFFTDWIFAMSAFWTTRASALAEIYLVFELFFYGRFAPMELLPPWLERISWLLPFRWAVWFPVELALNRLSRDEIVTGFHDAGVLVGRDTARVYVSCGYADCGSSRQWVDRCSECASCGHFSRSVCSTSLPIVPTSTCNWYSLAPRWRWRSVDWSLCSATPTRLVVGDLTRCLRYLECT